MWKCRRLGSTGWPQIWHGTAPADSAIGCSSKGSVLRILPPLALCPAFLPLGPFGAGDRSPRSPALKAGPQPSVIGVPRLQHRGEPSRFLFAALLGAGLLKAPMQPELLQGLLAVQLLLEPADGSLHRFPFFQSNFGHNRAAFFRRSFPSGPLWPVTMVRVCHVPNPNIKSHMQIRIATKAAGSRTRH